MLLFPFSNLLRMSLSLMTHHFCARLSKKSFHMVAFRPSIPFITIAVDHVAPPTATNLECFQHCARPLVFRVLEGFNGTVLAHGQVRPSFQNSRSFISVDLQSGSGKTHSMFGIPENEAEVKDKGIIPLTL